MRQLSKRPLTNWTESVAAQFLGMMAVLAIIAPFIAHIWRTVATDWAAMLLLGLVFFPVGWVHGLGVIFGWW